MDLPAFLGGTPVKLGHSKWPLVTEDDKRAVMRVLDRGILSGSFAPETRALEEEFASFVGAKHALLTHCGTSALQLTVAAAGAGEGDEVLVPAYSFVATPLAVALQGATPVFVDVDPETGHMDPALAEAAITARTKAIMPVHVHGEAADMTALLALGAKKKLAILEDAAQAQGAEHKGRRVGALGASGGFSLQSSKNLTSGEGGLFVTNDQGAAELANQVRNFGQDLHLSDAEHYDPERSLDGHRSLESIGMGSMYRGNEMSAAFARSQLKRLPERTAGCQKNAERLARKLGELPGVHPPRSLPGRTSVHHKYRVRLDAKQAGLDVAPKLLRDAMKAALAAEGCEVVIWQSAPLSAQHVFRAHTHAALRTQPGGTNLEENYDPARYPRTIALLDGSIVLFSHTCPLIAQSEATVDRYAEAFARVWHHRQAIVERFSATRR